METTQLYNGLTFLAYATGIIVILIGIMLTKVLFDLSVLTRNINDTTVIIKTELEPALKNINKSVGIISGVIIGTEAKIQNVKNFLSRTPLKILGGLSKLSNKASKGFWSGLCLALKMFGKK